MRPGPLVSVALVAALLCAQEPKNQRRMVTVEGCVQKTWLKVFQEAKSRGFEKPDLHEISYSAALHTSREIDAMSAPLCRSS